MAVSWRIYHVNDSAKGGVGSEMGSTRKYESTQSQCWVAPSIEASRPEWAPRWGRRVVAQEDRDLEVRTTQPTGGVAEKIDMETIEGTLGAVEGHVLHTWCGIDYGSGRRRAT